MLPVIPDPTMFGEHEVCPSNAVIFSRFVLLYKDI